MPYTMTINQPEHALEALMNAWPQIVTETRHVLGGELHYQAMVYHALRCNGVPLSQVGMNVKQWISEVTSPLFQRLDLKKVEAFRGGFEPIPDVVIFNTSISGNWQRRSFKSTLLHMRLAIEVKASERYRGRLREREIVFDIEKLAAHRHEVQRLGGDFLPVMMVIDVAMDQSERMTDTSLEASRDAAHREGIAFFYVDPARDIVDVPASFSPSPTPASSTTSRG